jgi:hypothetical protein
MGQTKSAMRSTVRFTRQPELDQDKSCRPCSERFCSLSPGTHNLVLDSLATGGIYRAIRRLSQLNLSFIEYFTMFAISSIYTWEMFINETSALAHQVQAESLEVVSIRNRVRGSW